MINRKQRPPNGPGANGLRANLNSYNSGKVLLGRWVDDHGGPIGYRRGFTTEDFQTECQHQQLGVVQKRPQLYGAALPAVEAVKNPFKPEDIFHPVTGLQPKDWSSNAHADFTTRDLVEYQPPMMMTREKLQEYRETWTTGREHERSSRFQTESVRAGNSAASAHLKVTQTRALPGAPIAVELFRKEILEIHGTLAFCALRYYLPPTTMTDDDLKSVAQSLGVTISKANFAKMMAFFTPGNSFSSEKFFATVIGKKHEFPFSGNVDRLYTQLCEEIGADMLSLDDVRGSWGTDLPPEIIEGLSMYLLAYAQEAMVARDSFHAMWYDWYVANPYAFMALSERVDFWPSSKK